MKKFISMAAAVLMTASLAACSSSTSTAAKASSAASSAKEETSATEEATATPETAKADYKVTNNTGEAVKELYVYSDASDKGDNYATDAGLADGAEVEIDLGDQPSDSQFTLEYVTESGRDAKFETLGAEEANISLISEDAMTGSTPLQFVTE